MFAWSSWFMYLYSDHLKKESFPLLLVGQNVSLTWLNSKSCLMLQENHSIFFQKQNEKRNRIAKTAENRCVLSFRKHFQCAFANMETSLEPLWWAEFSGGYAAPPPWGLNVLRFIWIKDQSHVTWPGWKKKIDETDKVYEVGWHDYLSDGEIHHFFGGQ